MIPGLVEGLTSGGLSLGGSLAGSWLTKESNEKAAKINADIQRELAQNGLSWRVADARKAGINPLAALGASLPSGSPVAVGTDYGDLGLGRAGQDISRAMTSKMTAEQREMHELNKRLLETQIEGQQLDNKARASQLGPPLPSAEFTSPGQKDPTVNIVPTQINSSERVGVESGAKPMFQKVINKDGTADYVLQKDLGDVMESDTPSWMKYMYQSFKDVGLSTGMTLSSALRKKFDPYLRKIRPKHENPDFEYQYDPDNMNWRPVYVGKRNRGSNIFVKEYRYKRQQHSW